MTYFATTWPMGFVVPMMIGTIVAAISVFAANWHDESPGSGGKRIERGVLAQCGRNPIAPWSES
jgi:hypothetical protein